MVSLHVVGLELDCAWQGIPAMFSRLDRRCGYKSGAVPYVPKGESRGGPFASGGPRESGGACGEPPAEMEGVRGTDWENESWL